LEVADYPGVFALGDCAVVPDKRTGKPHPPTAQHALREAKVCAHNIAVEIRGGKKKEFDFKMLGQLAAIGRRAGVAEILGMKFSGLPAWFLWRSIYLMKLPRFDRKVRVALDWTLDLFFGKDLVQYQTIRSEAMSAELADGGKMMPAIRTECADADSLH
jgi:NADH:quinone reductase (non-electrogenic)